MGQPLTAAVRYLSGEREPVRVATTGNITLQGLFVVDDVDLEVGDRVLVRAQTDPTQNGIYLASEGVWFRAPDASWTRAINKGTTVTVQEGTAFASRVFAFQAQDPVVGTDAITLARYFGDTAFLDVGTTAGTVAAGDDERIIFAEQAATFIDVAAAQAATIPARNKRLRTQFYALANLTGGANYRRISFADLGSMPALAYFRSADRFMPDGSTDNTNGGYWVLDEMHATAAMFGVVGGGADETTAIQQACDFAPGRQVSFVRGKTYGVSSITVKAGSEIITNDAIFRKVAASTSYAVTVQDDVVFDSIITSSPGGGPDRGIRVIGNRVSGRLLKATTDVPVDGFGVRIEGTISQSLTGLNIKKTATKNFSSQTQIFYVDDSFIGKSNVDTYVTGTYAINNKNTYIGSTFASGTHSSATGGAGNNAVLLEATADYGTDNLTFGKVVARDSAEHAVRLGGSFIMRDVLFSAITTYNTGSLVGSTGGAAFKALLDASNPGMHENIRVESLYFEDCSNGTAALANMAAVQIFRCRNSHFNNIVGRRKNNSFSCRLGIQVGSNDGVLFSNPDILDCETIVFNPLIPSGGYPANMKDVVIQGGRLAAKSVQVGTSPVYYNNTTGVWTNVSMRGVVVEEGRCCVRYETLSGGGAYTDCVFEGEYKHGSGNSGAAGPMEGAANFILMNVKSPLYGTMVMKDGSIWQDTTNSLVKIRKGGVYVTL